MLIQVSTWEDVFILDACIELHRIIASENPPWGSGNKVCLDVCLSVCVNVLLFTFSSVLILQG